MQQFSSSTSGENRALWLQWLFRIGLIGGLVYGGSLLINEFAPIINQAIKNIWILIGFGAPLAFLVGYVVLNPMVCWMWYKGICRKITSFFVKMDPLSFMDSYADLIESKLNKLRTRIITSLISKEKALEREIDAAKKAGAEAAKFGKAARDVGNKNQAGYYGTIVNNSQNTINIFMPLYTNVKAKRVFLEELAENWDYSARQLRETIKVKRNEYEILKTTVDGLKEAESWISSDNEAAKIYAMSVQALEETVTEKLGYITQFENKSKGLLDAIRLERGVRAEEGMAALEQFEENEQLFLPTDWNNITIDLKPNQYEVVTAKRNEGSGKFGKLTELN